MAKMEKLTEQQVFERRKRIPQRTQRILNEMIRRRYAELSGLTLPSRAAAQKG